MLEHEVRFECPCGPERALSVLTSLGATDLEDLADEQEQTEVRCNFCGQITSVGAADLRLLAARLRSVQS
jgi:molecular chaperone Hsp33